MASLALNQVTLAGNLTRDVELKYTQGGMAIGEIGLAINERVKKGDEWIDKVTFCDVTVFGKQAEWIAEGGGKGSPVLISGRLELDTWEKDGQKRSKLKIVANTAQLTERQQRSGGSQQQERPAPKQEQKTRNAPPPGDDIPFLWLVGFIAAAAQMPWMV